MRDTHFWHIFGTTVQARRARIAGGPRLLLQKVGLRSPPKKSKHYPRGRRVITEIFQMIATAYYSKPDRNIGTAQFDNFNDRSQFNSTETSQRMKISTVQTVKSWLLVCLFVWSPPPSYLSPIKSRMERRRRIRAEYYFSERQTLTLSRQQNKTKHNTTIIAVKCVVAVVNYNIYARNTEERNEKALHDVVWFQLDVVAWINDNV